MMVIQARALAHCERRSWQGAAQTPIRVPSISPAIDPRLDAAHGPTWQGWPWSFRPDQIADPNYHLGSRGSGLVGVRSTPVWKLQHASRTGSGARTYTSSPAVKCAGWCKSQQKAALLARAQFRMCVRIPRWPAFLGAKKRCAAQAEYGRLAAQA
jgi:hypothetical protein